MIINKFKKNFLRLTIILIIIISISIAFIMLYNKFFLEQAALNRLNTKISITKFILKDEKNTIELHKNKDSEKYINNIYDILDKKFIHFHKISFDRVKSVLACKTSTISFDGKSEYIIAHDGTIVAKILKEDMGKINLLNRFILSFNKDKYVYYCAKSKEYIKIPRQIAIILKKSIRLSNEKEIYKSISMLTPLKRKFGSKDEIKASQLIKDKMNAYGYQTVIQDFTFKYKLGNAKINSSPTIVNKKLEDKFKKQSQKEFSPYNSQNVISTKKAVGNSKGIIIICAHYDCSCDGGSTGAIDDGTGVSAVIEIAKSIKDISSDYELRFVFFSGEEAFLRGSTYYVTKLSKSDVNNIKAVIDLDTIGSISDNRFAMLTFSGKENNATNILKKFTDKLGIHIEKGPTSDYKAFIIKAIPALCIGQVPNNMDNMRSELHIDCSQDIMKNVDTHKVKLISDMIINALKELIINSAVN